MSILTLKAQDQSTATFCQLMLAHKGVDWLVSEEDTQGEICLSQGTIQLVGEEAIILALEYLKPEPSLFPNGNKGMPMALSFWRKKMAESSEDSTAQSGLVMRQMDDGRSFLQGEHLSLADIQAASWILNKSIEKSPMMQAWLNRVLSVLNNELEETIYLEDLLFETIEYLTIEKQEDEVKISSPLSV
ncbi:hypothetical protein QGN29_03730 [Temperatibacter marinus]|uniref:Glutathione S-transferase n=1 Tax=Temperatibacter marinus TaxID=1456591 RepID=A0AA52EET5_9PROT|nr:hypothetical protein [Temperatibacter marinus]WND03481.1 hypothetical protein QGN29_03730 [Temperatibacter marinus]